MILFQPEHVQPIIDGIKIKTRRPGKKRWRVESVHKAKTEMISRDYFALLRILTLHQEPLGAMTEKDAQEEGGYTLEGYKKEWEDIHGPCSWDTELVVWVVQFERVYSLDEICRRCWARVGCTSSTCCVKLFFEDRSRYAAPMEIIQYCCKERCHHGIEFHDHSCPVRLAGVCKEHISRNLKILPEKDGSGFVIKRLDDYV